MTNYNERPDDLTRFMKSIGWEFDENGYTFEDNYINFRAAEMLRQAITSLIAELVAEAKPTNYTPKGHHPDACLNHEKYTSACCGCQKQRARLQEIDEFEQNLLKALEEV